MKTDKNILIAFILNLFFSIVELIGGLLTNSIAIISDAIHDFGDSISIGTSYFLEKKSKKKPNKKYTYGYGRLSVLGATITNTILIIGSIIVIYNAILRIINPVEVNHNGMIIIAIIGTIVNFIAAYVTKEGDSLNQKVVNLHMLEDVLGWLAVLVSAVIIKFTSIKLIDPILSLLVAGFILINALKQLKKIIEVFLETSPSEIQIEELKKHLLEIPGIEDIHHIHVWSMDGSNIFATMHIVTKIKDVKELKHKIKEELNNHGISHTTIELEDIDECDEHECNIKPSTHHHHHH